MPLQERFQQALALLAGGRFAEAQSAFGALVESDPERKDFQCGFYSAGWWFNREDQRGFHREGRTLADWLMGEWDRYQSLAEERGYLNLSPFHAVMRAVLGEAAENYRIAFQQEGSSAADTALLKTLGVCLVRLEEYPDAVDILYYAKRKDARDAEIYFLLAEALASMDRDENRDRGLSFYRDLFFLNHRAVDPALMASEPAASVFRDLYEENEFDLERSLEWFPARLMATALFPGMRRLSEQELYDLDTELRRLTRDLEQVIEKYRERVLARLAFFYMCLIHHFRFHEVDPDAAEHAEDQLKRVAPQTYSVYREAWNRREKEKREKR